MITVAPTLNRAVLITGCQRSGTTLLHLILDSHPRIRGIDEDAFDESRHDEYLSAPEWGPVVSFKLPRVAWNTAFIRRIPGVLMIWCVRDPRDVVASMLRLSLPLQDGTRVSWAGHPHGAEYELHYAVPALARGSRPLEAPLRRRFARIRRRPPASRSREDQVFLAALCWRVKNQLLFEHRASMEMHVVCYERLVREPEPTLRRLLERVGVAWNDRVLHHHDLQRGTSIGGTDNTRPIDPGNTGRWAGELAAPELGTVRSLCAETAASFGYALHAGRQGG